MLAYKLAPLGKFNFIEPIINELLNGKRNAKDKVERWAYKITVNALYGIFASTYYRFKSVEVSDQTCFHGRQIITSTADYLRSLGYTVYYSDTDSIFVHGKYEEHETIQNLINKFVVDTYKINNIVFGLEQYWSVLGFPRNTKGEKAKKKYYGLIGVDKKGNTVNKFEEAGMETLRGDWSLLAQEAQDIIKKMQLTNTPREKMLDYYEQVKADLFAGKLNDKLPLDKHMAKRPEDYGLMKLNERTGKMKKMPTPPYVRAYKDALANDWIPTDMSKYGYVSIIMTKGEIPKLVNVAKPDEISYPWYVTRQLDPILYRLGVIEKITPYRKEKIHDASQTRL